MLRFQSEESSHRDLSLDLSRSFWKRIITVNLILIKLRDTDPAPVVTGEFRSSHLIESSSAQSGVDGAFALFVPVEKPKANPWQINSGREGESDLHFSTSLAKVSSCASLSVTGSLNRFDDADS